jgi:hypothetical protein
VGKKRERRRITERGKTSSLIFFRMVHLLLISQGVYSEKRLEARSFKEGKCLPRRNGRNIKTDGI